MKRFVLLLAVALTACAPRVAPPAVPGVGQPTAEAYIDPSYPTAQALVAQPEQSMSGIDVKMERAWRDGKNVNADVCFTLPDASDWSIWSASLNYGGALMQDYGTTLLSLEPAAEGRPGKRCDTLTFVVPPDADLSAAVITIHSIAAPPRADEYCSVYLPKIQQVLHERGIGITLECVDVNGTLTMQITGKPADMTQEQAEQIVYGDEFFTLKGPWTFPFNLAQ